MLEKTLRDVANVAETAEKRRKERDLSQRPDIPYGDLRRKYHRLLFEKKRTVTIDRGEEFGWSDRYEKRSYWPGPEIKKAKKLEDRCGIPLPASMIIKGYKTIVDALRKKEQSSYQWYGLLRQMYSVFQVPIPSEIVTDVYKIIAERLNKEYYVQQNLSQMYGFYNLTGIEIPPATISLVYSELLGLVDKIGGDKRIDHVLEVYEKFRVPVDEAIIERAKQKLAVKTQKRIGGNKFKRRMERVTNLPSI